MNLHKILNIYGFTRKSQYSKYYELCCSNIKYVVEYKRADRYRLYVWETKKWCEVTAGGTFDINNVFQSKCGSKDFEAFYSYVLTRQRILRIDEIIKIL